MSFRSDIVDLGSARVRSGVADPTAGGGIAAPEGSLYLRHVAAAGQLYVKTGAGNTDWTAIGAGGGGSGWEALEVQEPSGVNFFDFNTVLTNDNRSIYRVVGYTAAIGTLDAVLVWRYNGATPGASSFMRTYFNVQTSANAPESVQGPSGRPFATETLGVGVDANIFIDTVFMAIEDSGLMNRPIMTQARIAADPLADSWQSNQFNSAFITDGYNLDIASIGLATLGTFDFPAGSRFYLQRIVVP